MCEELNKDSIAQWIFCRLVGSRKEGTGLQVLEASQGGLHPAAGARCEVINLFSSVLYFVCVFLNLLICLLLGNFGFELNFKFMPLGLYHFCFFQCFERFYRLYFD